MLHLRKLIILKHVGNGILKKNHPFDKTLDVELFCYFFPAFFNIVHKLPFEIRLKPLYKSIKVILKETKNVD